MGLTASWECWGTGLIPGLARWAKDLVLSQLWLRSQERKKGGEEGRKRKKKETSSHQYENFPQRVTKVHNNQG